MTSVNLGRGVFEPDQLAEMQDVFHEITSMPWFSRDPGARKAFAKYLIDTFPSGTYEPEKHRAELEAFARAHYARLDRSIQR